MKALDPRTGIVHVYDAYTAPLDLGYGNIGEYDVRVTNCDREVPTGWRTLNYDAMATCLLCLGRRG